MICFIVRNKHIFVLLRFKKHRKNNYSPSTENFGQHSENRAQQISRRNVYTYRGKQKYTVLKIDDRKLEMSF